jgi:hypothetical protein
MVTGIRVTRGVLLSAMVSVAMAAAAVGGAPTAAADCASFFGLGNTAQCQSGPASIAIAVGPNATAKAGGLFGVAFAIGVAPVSGVGTAGEATATTTGAFTFALAAGDQVTAQAGDLFGIAMQWGNNGQTITEGVANIAQGWTNPFGGDPSATWVETTLASGFGNQILNGAFADGPGYSGEAVGVSNFAFNGWGFDNVVNAGGTATSFFNVALDAFNAGNVTAGPGPLAVAVAFNQLAGETTSQVGPGINVKVGTATPVFPVSAASFRSTKKAGTTAAAGVGVGIGNGKKTGVASAAHRGHRR